MADTLAHNFSNTAYYLRAKLIFIFSKSSRKTNADTLAQDFFAISLNINIRSNQYNITNQGLF